MSGSYDLKGRKVWVAGHRGMVGSAVTRRLGAESCDIVVSDRSALDLRSQEGVRAFLAQEKPQAIVIAAAKVGGILANRDFPAQFLYDNLMIEANIIHAAYESGVEKLLFLGSSCIYPKFAPQPLREDALLTGALEPTNEWYAIAKIAGVKLCDAYRRQYGSRFISAMPTNLYGPGDNFDLQSSHVLPALMRKIHAAKLADAPEVEIWGSGTPLREFLHVDDLADACIHLLKHFDREGPINVGSGHELTIAALAGVLADVIGYRGHFRFDASKPDGTPRKLLDTSELDVLGWRARIGLEQGIEGTYRWFCENIAKT
ncbi:GDP-L-fucose synthase [Labrys monachus]|uniref:GDP-L-fucose synthase n=1 Tax=Labrys monachus TaxID=217067 RepID=A0ABU0F8H1_9HYPH|nr:GDP-L-fucose synthase [Labrys monachus]MDQ0390662.1 GDP-L-fucose synthase [Labrys monachus]